MKKEQSVWVSAVVIIGVLTDVAAAGTITIIPAVLLWRIRPLPAGTGVIPAVRETVFPRRREAAVAAALPSRAAVPQDAAVIPPGGIPAGRTAAIPAAHGETAAAGAGTGAGTGITVPAGIPGGTRRTTGAFGQEAVPATTAVTAAATMPATASAIRLAVRTARPPELLSSPEAAAPAGDEEKIRLRLGKRLL